MAVYVGRAAASSFGSMQVCSAFDRTSAPVGACGGSRTAARAVVAAATAAKGFGRIFARGWTRADDGVAVGDKGRDPDSSPCFAAFAAASAATACCSSAVRLVEASGGRCS